MMSIALESSTSNRVGRSGLCHGMSYGSIYDSPESGIFAGDRGLTTENTTAAPAPATKNVVEDQEVEAEASSSSSIGRNSDSSGGVSDGDRDSGEVQSSYKGPLDTLDALEEVLPMKRGISKFYCGKSKSFTSLGEAGSCSSIKDLVKPDNAYTRKRKNLLAYSIFWDKNRNYPLASKCGSLSKRPATSRSTLALAGCGNENNNIASANSNSSPPAPCRPPLYPHSRISPNIESPSASPPRRSLSPWRSFSLSDLQGAAAANSNSSGRLVNGNGDKDKLQ